MLEIKAKDKLGLSTETFKSSDLKDTKETLLELQSQQKDLSAFYD